MTYAILWALCPIVWAGGTAVWPMLLLILGLNRVGARVLRLGRDDAHAPLEWRDG